MTEQELTEQVDVLPRCHPVTADCVSYHWCHFCKHEWSDTCEVCAQAFAFEGRCYWEERNSKND